MDTREAITKELLAGTTPAQLARTYPRKSVYRIFNELLQDGHLSKDGFVPAEINDDDEEDIPGIEHEQPLRTTTSAMPVTKTKARVSGHVGAEVVSFPGDVAFPASAVDRIRGILGITLRPKVLSCPMPELLYPAMVIAVNDFGFPPMRPDDFIDTVLYQWLESCDVIPYAYIKKSEAEEFAKKYGVSEDYIKGYVEQHGLMNEEQFAKKHGIVLPEEPEKVEVAEEAKPIVVEPTEESENDTEEVPSEEIAEVVSSEHKPTVGDLLGTLHINSIRQNIKQEVVENDSAARRTESDSPQGNNEPGE